MAWLHRLVLACRHALAASRVPGLPWTGVPSAAEKVAFAAAIVHTSAILGQRRLTTTDQESLRAAILAGISPNAALITEDDLARWTGLPSSLLQSYLNALRMATPLLTKETINIARAAREQHERAQAAAHSAAAGYGDGSSTVSAWGGDPGSGYGAGYDPGAAGSFDPAQDWSGSAAGISDPAWVPAGDGSADFSALGGLTLEGLAGSALISAVWVAILDWEDLRAGEIDVGHWLGQRVIISAQNQAAIAIGGTVGGMLGGPVGAAVLGFAAAAIATAARAAYRSWQGSEDNAVYEAERVACDAAFGELCGHYDRRILHLRAVYQADCARARAGEPKEADYPDIERVTTAVFEATRNAVLVLPRRRQFPGNLTARQRRPLRRQLRARRRQWLALLDAAAAQMKEGQFLPALHLALAINEAVLNQFNELVIVDWTQLSTRLAATAGTWEADRKFWLARSMRGVQQCLAAYQSAADGEHRSFLAEKEKLARRRLDALLVLVNKFRRRTSRRPLRSTGELLEYIRAGRINPKVR